VPLWQNFEQQSAPLVHWLPMVLHVELSAAHLPPVHVWLQQSPLLVQAPLSDVQAG
jgi:hypothetical protein